MTKRRASMREGPLADLFRATQSPQETPPEPAPPAEPPGAETASPAPPAPEPAPQPHLQAVPGPDEVAPAPRETHMPYTPARDASSYLAMIRVVGVGGAGLNAVRRMMEAEIQGVEFVAVNTDVQQLAMSEAPVKMQLGRELTRGLGSGADSEVGRRAAEGAVDRMREILRGSDLVFVAAGEGGGTGTGAAPSWRAWRASSVRSPSASSPRRSGSRGRGARPWPTTAWRACRPRSTRSSPCPTTACSRCSTEHLDGGRLPRGRRRAAPGRAGHLRPHHARPG